MSDTETQRINREILKIRGELADLHKQLDEAERRPEEILQAIELIWN